MQYEYRQDLRYWYGTGPGALNNASVMLPVIQGVVDILLSGPETPVKTESGEMEVLGPLAVAFTHDNQINQMVSSLGIFDAQPALAADSMNETRVSIHIPPQKCGVRKDLRIDADDDCAPKQIYVSSRNNPMRGTVTMERLNCDEEPYLRILLNDAVYRERPIPKSRILLPYSRLSSLHPILLFLSLSLSPRRPLPGKRNN